MCKQSENFKLFIINIIIMSINTKSFNIDYNDIKEEYPLTISIELYRDELYKELLIYAEKIRKELLQKEQSLHEFIKIDERNEFVSEPLLRDFISMFIINHKFESNIDPLFDSKTPFEKSTVIDYFNKDCITTYTELTKKAIIEILPHLTNLYIENFNKINIKLKEKNDKYDVDYKIIDEKFFEIDGKLKIPIHIFKHLVKLYNTKNLYNYTSTDILDEKVVEYIYIVFLRYRTFSNGNNQASILPSFKKILKEKLNIKVELFGSPLNTSTAIFGSFFYDIDKYFGSIGNYFSTDIKKGYYEINPVFDKCLIDNIIIKSTNELIKAQKNKLPLLLCFILPLSYSSSVKLPERFIIKNIVVKKEDFPYIRYNRDFTKTIVSTIVNTRIIICHTSFITSFVKYNVSQFQEILKNWKK